MSIVYLATRQRKSRVRRSRLRGVAPAAAPDLSEVLKGLTAYLPAEAIATYTTALAFFQGQKTAVLWAVAIIVGVLALALTAALSRRSAHQRGFKYKVPVGDMAVVAFAFAIYALAMPGSAMWTTSWFSAAWAGGISVLGHLALLIVAIWRED